MELKIPIKQINMPSDIRTVNELRVLELYRRTCPAYQEEIEESR